MRYKIIKGNFHVKGYSPDGDSIRFQAVDEDNWDFFRWRTQSKRKAKKKQLRFEAIDALETHYEESHQPRSFGVAALEVLLQMLGIDQVVYNLNLTKIVSASDGTGGYIAAPALDSYQRPISLVFTEEVRLEDGAEVEIARLPIEDSVNFKLAKLGLVYPTFYSSMESDLLDKFTTVAREARKNGVGVWSLDRTRSFTFWNIDTIRNDVVILPKLFRRLTTFLEASSEYSELEAYLKKKKDRVLIRSTGEKKKMFDLMEIDGREIKFLTNPEDLIFDPKG